MIHLIKQTDKKQAPRFFITCGTEDGLYEASVYATEQMKKRRLDVTFEEGPGAHDWDFWDKWIQRVLVWIEEK